MADYNNDTVLIIITEDVHGTIGWGRLLGRLVRGGDFIALVGPIGAGKTVFAFGILEGLGIIPDMGSPTFTIMHKYEGAVPVIHMDLYRLGETAPQEDLGWDELFEGQAVVVVEWAEFVRRHWPEEHLQVEIERQEGSPGTRKLTFLGKGERGRAIVQGLRAGSGGADPDI